MSISFSAIKHTFKDESLSFIAPSDEEMRQLYHQLGVVVRADARSENIELLVALGRGGWPVGRELSDSLDLPALNMSYVSYTGVGEQAKISLLQDVPTVQVTGRNILIVDDVADSGKTLVQAKQDLDKHGVASLMTATIFHKKSSIVKPDFMVAETDSWIIFPYEHREAGRELSQRWQEMGVPDAEISARLAELSLRTTEGFLNSKK